MTMITRVKLPNHYDNPDRHTAGDPLDPPKRYRAPAEIGRTVTWLEEGRRLTGQVWDICANRTNREQCHVGQLWWIVVAPDSAAFPGELRVASFGAGQAVGYWQHTPGGRCIRDGKPAQAA